MNSVHGEDQKNQEATGIPDPDGYRGRNEDMPGKFMVFRRTLVEDPCNSLVINFRLTGKAILRKSR